jgi:hypothetical protein
MADDASGELGRVRHQLGTVQEELQNVQEELQNVKHQLAVARGWQDASPRNSLPELVRNLAVMSVPADDSGCLGIRNADLQYTATLAQRVLHEAGAMASGKHCMKVTLALKMLNNALCRHWGDIHGVSSLLYMDQQFTAGVLAVAMKRLDWDLSWRLDLCGAASRFFLTSSVKRGFNWLEYADTNMAHDFGALLKEAVDLAVNDQFIDCAVPMCEAATAIVAKDAACLHAFIKAGGYDAVCALAVCAAPERVREAALALSRACALAAPSASTLQS